ncbi:DUF6415 family natural product biosynthesis protein [Streptomyces sp. NPDC006334]|uniref:DUF6415 family natural product biosynthesis protein n=1 Tax=Streptomyces sp. NPDC006334 TaxID=3156754 RepID=UPI0033B084D0
MRGSEALAAVPVDEHSIREACNDVLWAKSLPTGRQLDATCEQLAGHVGLLIPEVMGLAARMRTSMRLMAVHCLVRAHQALAVDPGAGRREAYVYDVATCARALLTLLERPGPLGEPVGEDEIEAAVRRRICGGCCGPIEPGEGFEEVVFASEASGGLHGYRHTDSCTVVAAERRALLAVAEEPPEHPSGGASDDAAVGHR